MFHIVMHNDTVELFPMLQQCNLNDFCFTGLCSVIKPGHCSKCCFSLCCLTQYRIRYCKQLFSISLEGGSSVCPLFVLPFYLQVGFDQKHLKPNIIYSLQRLFLDLCPQLVVPYRTMLVAGVLELVFWYAAVLGSGGIGEEIALQTTNIVFQNFFIEIISQSYY